MTVSIYCLACILACFFFLSKSNSNTLNNKKKNTIDYICTHTSEDTAITIPLSKQCCYLKAIYSTNIK